jgi:mono/diheme cytochrome c family protein
LKGDKITIEGGTLKYSTMILCLIAVMVVWTASNIAQNDAGQQVYSRKCAACHGADGVAKPALEKSMGVTMKPLASKDVQAKTDADLKKNIVEGVGKMKPVSGMTPADVDAVIKLMRTLKK